MKNFYLLLFLALLSFCSGKKASVQGELSFQTRDDSELWFKNIRQSNYDLQEEKEARINIFRHKKRDENDNLNVAIAHNWVNDMAFIMLEWDDKLSEKNSFEVFSANNGPSLPYTPGNVRQQTEFSRKVYNLSQDSEFLYTLHEGDTIRFLSTARQRDAFQTTMEDYFRLIGID